MALGYKYCAVAGGFVLSHIWFSLCVYCYSFACSWVVFWVGYSTEHIKHYTIATPCMSVDMGWVVSWCGISNGFADLRSVLEMSHVMHCNGCAEYRPCTMKTYYTESGTDFLWLCEECYDKYGWPRYVDVDVYVDAVMLMFDFGDRERVDWSGMSLDDLECWFWLCSGVVEIIFMIEWFLSGCIWRVQRSRYPPWPGLDAILQ